MNTERARDRSDDGFRASEKTGLPKSAVPDPETTSAPPFTPTDQTTSPPSFSLPGQQWTSLLSAPCTFALEHFEAVMENMIRNPNLTSSHLFRAEIYYDSLNDVSVRPEALASRDDKCNSSKLDASAVDDDVDQIAVDFSKFTVHMRRGCRPRRLHAVPAGYTWHRTWVRRLVPRNPQLDADLVQTCHMFKNERLGDGESEKTLLFYIPHVSNEHELPWYHPGVRILAFQYIDYTTSSGTLSLHCCLFSSQASDAIPQRLRRTSLKILQTVHRHGHGRAAGYQKRVHHDVVVPQDRVQDTYTRLKGKYARTLVGEWVEQTDPTKHVFEDLGIAAFLMEIWRQMYGIETEALNEGQSREGLPADSTGRPSQGNSHTGTKKFPGFVDIGCGNGVLVYVLVQEGYEGWGFDIRKRKTWETFPMKIREQLKEMVLVPEIFTKEAASKGPHAVASKTSVKDDKVGQTQPELHPNMALEGLPPNCHDGLFPAGTFIISNHADELTGWTPLLAYLSSAAFVAIPCCSHDLAGTRFRASATPKHSTTAGSSKSDTQKAGKSKVPSAYASLCAWVERLTAEVGFEVEKEMLRIPSTRNAAILGRRIRPEQEAELQIVSSENGKSKVIQDLVERELGKGVPTAARDWLDRVQRLVLSKGSGH